MKSETGGKPKGFPEYEFKTEQGSAEVWAEGTFEDAKPVYVGDPKTEPKHLEGED